MCSSISSLRSFCGSEITEPDFWPSCLKTCQWNKLYFYVAMFWVKIQPSIEVKYVKAREGATLCQPEKRCMLGWGLDCCLNPSPHKWPVLCWVTILCERFVCPYIWASGHYWSFLLREKSSCQKWKINQVTSWFLIPAVFSVLLLQQWRGNKNKKKKEVICGVKVTCCTFSSPCFNIRVIWTARGLLFEFWLAVDLKTFLHLVKQRQKKKSHIQLLFRQQYESWITCSCFCLFFFYFIWVWSGNQGFSNQKTNTSTGRKKTKQEIHCNDHLLSHGPELAILFLVIQNSLKFCF